MKLYELTINEFLQRVDSPTPTPGGGSVSALAIVQGISLIRMVGHLTISKKKFNELSENVKLDYMSRISALDEIKLEVLELIDKDTNAFNDIMASYKLPKVTDEEKKYRTEQINLATIHATEVPLQTAKLAYKSLELAEPTFVYANKSATSDFGVGINLIHAGLNGAIFNVKTNMHEFADIEISRKYYQEVEELEKNANIILKRLIEAVNSEFLLN